MLESNTGCLFEAFQFEYADKVNVLIFEKFSLLTSE